MPQLRRATRPSDRRRSGYHLVVGIVHEELGTEAGGHVSSWVLTTRIAVVAWDTTSWLLAFGAFLLVRHDLTLSEEVWGITTTYLVAAMLLQILGGYYLHLTAGDLRPRAIGPEHCHMKAEVACHRSM